MIFFSLPTWGLACILGAVAFGASALALVAGHRARDRSTGLREPLGVVQAALLTLVGLVLAFGLTLAIDRYEGRRGAVVIEANAIGTTYLELMVRGMRADPGPPSPLTVTLPAMDRMDSVLQRWQPPRRG